MVLEFNFIILMCRFVCVDVGMYVHMGAGTLRGQGH